MIWWKIWGIDPRRQQQDYSINNNIISSIQQQLQGIVTVNNFEVHSVIITISFAIVTIYLATIA